MMESPELEHECELIQFELEHLKYDPAKRLKSKEAHYVMLPYMSGDIYVIRETEEGWWREEIDYEKNPMLQIEKLIADPTVGSLFCGTPRFSEPGGWADPNG